MSKPMRAKVYVSAVERLVGSDGKVSQEKVSFHAVSKSGSYPADGSDEDNTFAKFSPMANFTITIANPALLETYLPGQKFYVDFSPVE